MKKKINFNKNEEVTKNQKLEKLGLTIKILRRIYKENDLQMNYISNYDKEIWDFQLWEYKTISSEDYTRFVKLQREILDKKIEFESLINKMIRECVNEIDNV